MVFCLHSDCDCGDLGISCELGVEPSEEERPVPHRRHSAYLAGQNRAAENGCECAKIIPGSWIIREGNDDHRRNSRIDALGFEQR